MHDTRPPIVIISAARAEDSSRHAELGTRLQANGFRAHAAVGSWHGVEEPNYVVILEDPSQLPALTEIGNDFGQADILYVTEETRDAYLVECATGLRTDIGRFRAVSATVAKASPGWTKFDERYFVAQ